MENSLEAELLKNAIEIGKEIIDKAIIDSNGIHWKTVKSITIMGDLETDVDETISTGVSGIILFYTELYNATKSEIYLEYINSSAQWLINHCQKKPATHGFYSGRMGVVFVLLKVAEVTQREHYHQKAIEIAMQFKNITTVPTQNYNLYNGLAGSILGLLYLHAELKENWILDSIFEGVEDLIKNVKSNNIGFYWDVPFVESKVISTKPLCSMPLGSGGIGLLFLYLSQYFDNRDYEYVGMQALNYEDQYYNESLTNWKDFRLDVDYKTLKRLRNSYLKGDHSHFESKNYCADWIFGIVGNSFTRLSAYYILKDKYSNNIINAIESKLNVNDIESQLSNYTIATGKSGLGLLLITQSYFKKNKVFLENALSLAKKGINERATKGFYQFGFNVDEEYEDDSLLMGNAGIGYFYLKLLTKDSDHILLPTLKNNSNTTCDHELYHFSIDQTISKITSAWYPNTYNVIKSSLAPKISGLNSELLKKSLTTNIEQSIAGLQNPQATDAYNYDKLKLNIQDIIADDYGHFRLCSTTEISKNKDLLENKSREWLMGKTLQLNQYSYFLTSRWDWKNSLPNYVQNSPKGINTLYSLGEEHTLSEFEFPILNCFKSAKKVNNVYKICIDINESNTLDQDYLFHSFIDTIRYYMSKGILTCVEKKTFQFLN